MPDLVRSAGLMIVDAVGALEKVVTALAPLIVTVLQELTFVVPAAVDASRTRVGARAADVCNRIKHQMYVCTVCQAKLMIFLKFIGLSFTTENHGQNSTICMR